MTGPRPRAANDTDEGHGRREASVRRASAAAPPLSRWYRRSSVAAGVIAAGLAVVPVGTMQVPGPGALSASSSTVGLVDDDGEKALFSSEQLVPGQVDTACIGLTASGSVDPSTEVTLNADDVPTGGLAPYLEVSIDRIDAPAGGSCADFSGTSVFRNTLDQLPGGGVAGLPTGWHPAVLEHVVYRFTVSVLDNSAAQGLSTSATFRWSFEESGAGSDSDPTATPAPEPSLTP